MVAHLQHIGLQVRTAVHKVGLRGLFHVTGQQEAGGAVVDAQHHGGIVGVAVLRATGPSMVTVAPPSGQTVPTAGTSTCKPCCWVYLTKSLKALGGGLGHRAVHVVRREVGQCGGKPAYMVLMCVGAEHIFQLFHPPDFCR